jgi:hypothetical protein
LKVQRQLVNNPKSVHFLWFSNNVMLPMSRIEKNTWTQWWWLRLDQRKTWSVEELKAAKLLGITFVSFALFCLVMCFTQLLRFHLGAALNVVISLSVSFAITVPHARDIAGSMFSEVVLTGDIAAARRLGGTIPKRKEKTAVLSVWWLEYKGTYGWSNEERWTRNVIFAIAGVLFVAPLSFEISLFDALGMSKGARAAVLVLAILPLSLYLGRRLCAWMWPEYVQRADVLARERQNSSKS